MAAFHGVLDVVARLLEGKVVDINEMDENGLTALHHACQQGDGDIVRFLLQEGARYDIYTKKGSSVLHEAVYSGNVEIVDMLLRKSFPSVDMRNNENWTAAHEAVKEGHIGVLEKLVERGADLEACVKDGSSSLILAAFHGRFEMVKWLLDKGLQVNAVDEEGCSALHSVLLGTDISVPIISHLLSQGADIHARTKSGRSVLDFAVIKGETKIVELLFQTTNVDVNARDEQGTTALHVAASCNRSNIMKILINQKADLSACRNGGWTALHNAASNGAIDAVEVLLAHGAEVDVKDTNGTTALFKAAHRGKQDVVRRLIAHKADVNASSIHQWLPMHAAARSGDVETIKLLVQHGANVHGLTENGSNVLHLAINSGSNEAVKYLVHLVQDVNAVDQEGLTALHSAVQYCDIDIVKFLVENGANIHAVAKNTKSVMFMAAQYGRRDIVEYLQTKGLEVNETDENGRTPLHVAAQIGDLDAIKLLVEKGADLYALTKSRASALHVAAAKGNADIIDYLIQSGLDVNAVEESKRWAPIHAAASNGSENVLKSLVKHGADIDALTMHGETAFHLAISFGKREAAEYLVQQMVDMNVVDERGRTALHCLRYAWGSDCAPVLLGANGHASINLGNENGFCPLHSVAEAHCANEVGDLLKNGADVAISTTTGRSQVELTTMDRNAPNAMQPLLMALLRGEARIVGEGASSVTHLDAALICAAKEGNARAVASLLDRGANVESKNNKKWTPLMMAVKFAHVDVIRLLLQAGAKPTARAYDGVTALQIAARFGHVKVVRLLLRAGVTVNARGSNELTAQLAHGDKDDLATALMHAVKEGHIQVVETLLRHGADIESNGNEGMTPLILATTKGHEQLVCKLLKNGASPLATYGDGWSALHAAVAFNYEGILRLLILAGADVLSQNKNGQTVFLDACSEGKINLAIAMVETVVASGGEKITMLETSQVDGATPLIVSAFRGHVDVVKYLIEQGAAIHHVNARGDDALLAAAQEGQMSIVEYLLGVGANVEHKNNKGATALMAASAKGHTEIIRVLKKHGACFGSRTRTDRTALSIASGQRGNVETVITLLRDGEGTEEVNLPDADGVTPLVRASMSSDVDTVTALLEHGADPELQADIGGTAIHYASQYGQYAIVERLIAHGAKVNVQGFDGFTPLIIAADAGYADVCQLLIANGADLTMQTNQGHTALHRAVFFHHVNSVRALVEAGMDVNIPDDDGLTAVYWAALSGFFDLVEYFESFPGVNPLSKGKVNPLWPLSALLEVHGQPLDHVQRIDPPWFVDSSTISTSVLTIPTRPAIITYTGVWHGCTIDIVEIFCGTQSFSTTIFPHLFVNEVSRWIPLHHPHLLRLYGACHRDRLYFVVEHTRRDSFRSYVSKNRSRMWQMLYQVGLGILYLHERTIIHSALRGDVIRIGSDGLPKVGGFGHILQLSRDPSSDIRWRAPEAVDQTRSSMESDVYSFAMCIIEAVSGDIPYSDEADNSKVLELIEVGERPARHSNFTDQAWNLVIRMTHESRNLRVRMPEVVEELESLARQEKEDCSSGYHGNEKTSMDEKPSPSEVENLLRKAADLCEKTGDPRTSPHLLGRLTAVLHQIDPEDDPHESTRRLRAYMLILERYIQELKRHKNAQESSRLAFNRRHITTVYSLHNELDRLVYELRTNDLDTSTAWRKALRKWQHDQLELAEENLRDTMVWLREGPTLSHEDTDKLTCMLFELKNNHISYRPIPSGIIRGACTAILSVLPDKMPKWFLPWYEIDASSSYISSGGFAKVYRGRWMGSEVVCKKLEPSVNDDPSAFMKEVGLWVMFDHPHVIKLFGACHLRKRVFVSEWAEHGRLDVYVQKHGHVWQKLYEVALGLQYLHARGVIHCDLKCDNILVGRDHMAKVADFGLSWFSSVTGKDQQQTYGNPRWAAPEVLQGEPPSKESDIYSFGMCIVEAVSGEVPYKNVDDNSIVKHNIIAEGFHHSYDDQLFSEGQRDLVLQCCHREPSKRTTMDYILKSLSQFADEAHEQTSRSVVDDEKEEIELLGGQLEKRLSSKSSLHVSSHQKWSVASDRSVGRFW